MATNPFFYEDRSVCEQNLIEDIVIEFIQISGMDCYFIKQTFSSVDKILGEDNLMAFKDAYLIELYPETTVYSGEGEFVSKFGIEIKNKLIFAVSVKRFKEVVKQERPHEGDLIWVPLAKNFFEVIYVQDNTPFFTLGSNYTFQMTCQSWNYSNEELNTSEAVLNEFANNKKEFTAQDDNDEFNSFGDTIITGNNIFNVRTK